MTDYSPNVNMNSNSQSVDDDSFERDLKDMLNDGPSVGDLGSTSQGGNVKPLDLGSGTQRTYPPSSLPSTTSAYPTTSPFSSGAATTDIPLSSPPSQSNSASGPGFLNATSPVQLRLENIKDWSISTFKCTKQMISERLGKSQRTVDLELEAQIESLRDTQRKYLNILRLARALTSHFQNVVSTQRQLGDAFSDMSQKSPELLEEFSYNSETQKVLSKNGETLLGALTFFTSSVNTLCNKTMEDTILTIKNYESSRLEFDAYKADFESQKAAPRDHASAVKFEDSSRKFEQHKAKFEKLRADVGVKLRFLDENKVKVMHKQLLLFHNAVSAYFSGNQTALEGTMRQFNIKLKPPNSETPSWIEK